MSPRLASAFASARAERVTPASDWRSCSRSNATDIFRSLNRVPARDWPRWNPRMAYGKLLRNAGTDRGIPAPANGAFSPAPHTFPPQLPLSPVTHPGSLRSQPSAVRQFLYFWLTRWPRLYLLLEGMRPRGNWDKRVYLSFVRRGDVVLDIGANFGSHTILFSHLAGRPGSVLAFEPVSASFEALRETVEARARFPNIRLLNVAIGDPSLPNETVTIKVPSGDFGQASLRVQNAGSWESQPNIVEYPVSIRRLDDEESVRDLPRIDFVKIDVEGGELDVLKGARATLTRHLPLLYCEIYESWAASFGYSPADLIFFVRSLGYTHARVLSKMRVHRLELGSPIPPGWFDASSDVLFFTDENSSLVSAFDRRFRSAARGAG